MAQSTCIKCGGKSFEIMVQEPLHSNFKIVFVQCDNCGGVVGTLDAGNAAYMASKICDHLGIQLEI